MKKLSFLSFIFLVIVYALVVGVRDVKASGEASVESTAESSDGVAYTYTTSVTYNWTDPDGYQNALNQANAVASAIAAAVAVQTSTNINTVANSSQAITEALAAVGVNPPDTVATGSINSGDGWSATNAGSGTTVSQRASFSSQSSSETPPPVQFCGDNSCHNGETCSSCPGDCGACPPPNCTPTGVNTYEECSVTECGTTGTRRVTDSCGVVSNESCSTQPCGSICTPDCSRANQVCLKQLFDDPNRCVDNGKNQCEGTRSCDYNWKEVAP